MLALGNVDSLIDTRRAPVTRRAQQIKHEQRRERKKEDLEEGRQAEKQAAQPKKEVKLRQ